MESTISTIIATTTSKTIETNPFFSLNYWVGSPSGFPLKILIILGLISTLPIVFVLLVTVFKFLSPKLTAPESKFFNKIIFWTIGFGPLGWLLILFRKFQIPFLSARILWVLWLISFLGVLLYLFIYYRNKLPVQKQKFFSYQLKKRYFPKKKR